MFIDVYDSICAAHGIAPTKVLDDIGMHRSTYTGWKDGGTPSNKTKKMIADYFGITVTELMTFEDKKIPVILSDDGQREIAEIFSSLSSENRAKLLELARLYLASQHKSGESK